MPNKQRSYNGAAAATRRSCCLLMLHGAAQNNAHNFPTRAPNFFQNASSWELVSQDENELVEGSVRRLLPQPQMRGSAIELNKGETQN